MATSALTAIVPADPLHSTIPFYLLGMIPIVAADAAMSYRFWRPFAIPVYAAGAIVGLAFFMLYYPLITHTYNQVLDPTRLVWPSLTDEIYFDMIREVYPLVAVPAAAFGVVGAIAANKIVARKSILENSA